MNIRKIINDFCVDFTILHPFLVKLFISFSETYSHAAQSHAVGLSNVLSRTHLNEIRQLQSPDRSRMSMDQSPFQLSHISHAEEELEEYDKTISKMLKQIDHKRKI